MRTLPLSNSIETPESHNLVRLLADTPAEEDFLDYGLYRDAIASVISGLRSDTPLIVSVFGEWGSGKTTLMHMVQEKLKSQGTRSIWINVWQFGNDEDIWRAFLQSILVFIREQLPLHKKWLFNLGLLRRRIHWSGVKTKIPELLIRLVIVLVPLYLSLAGLIPSDAPSSAPGQAVAVAGGIVGAVLGWYLLLQPYIKAVKERVRVDLQGLVASSPLEKRVTLFEEFKGFFLIMMHTLVGEKGKLIVFIDDLDRCPPDRIVQVLDAIKLFLDVPGCVYLIGLDREIVEQAVTLRFSSYREPRVEARKYLEKIINLPFDLPPLSGEQMGTLVSRVGSNLPDFERCSPVFALGQEANPRKVKRTINAFLLTWALATRRTELTQRITPVRLAKLVVIQQSYRDLYVILTMFPDYLGKLEVFFRQIGEDHRTPSPSVGRNGPDQKALGATTLPEYLQPFLANQNLKRLLTLHPTEGEAGIGANFVTVENGVLLPLSDREVAVYIRLTRSISQQVVSDDYDTEEVGEIADRRRRPPRTPSRANLSAHVVPDGGSQKVQASHGVLRGTITSKDKCETGDDVGLREHAVSQRRITRVTFKTFFAISDDSPRLNSTLRGAALRGASDFRWPAGIEEIVAKRLDELLDGVDVFVIMVAAWNKDLLLRQYAVGKQAPDETVLVSLADHTITSTHHPYIDILVNQLPVTRIEFTISVELALKGVVLTVRDGRVVGIRVESCNGKGILTYHDLVLLKREMSSFTLPSSDLIEGIPIAP